MTPGLASRRASIAANARWAQVEDRVAATEPARRASAASLDTRLTEQYGMDPNAPGYGVQLRNARTAHFQKMSLKGAKTLARNRKRKQAQRKQVSA